MILQATLLVELDNENSTNEAKSDLIKWFKIKSDTNVEINNTKLISFELQDIKIEDS